jgi:kynureninase
VLDSTRGGGAVCAFEVLTNTLLLHTRCCSSACSFWTGSALSYYFFSSGVTELQTCRCPELKVMVDGAHMLGQVPVDVSSMHADYFATNCHKWLCGARGSAVLWVAENAQAGFEPLVKSHGHGSGFASDFIWSGMSRLLHSWCCQQHKLGPVNQVFNDARLIIYLF